MPPRRCWTHLAAMWRWHDEESVHSMVTEVRGSLVSVAGLHLVLPRERIQGGPRNMHPAGLPARLHVVGQGDVVGPNVELPLPEAQNTAEHSARVDANAHVQDDVSGLHHSAV